MTPQLTDAHIVACLLIYSLIMGLGIAAYGTVRALVVWVFRKRP